MTNEEKEKIIMWVLNNDKDFSRQVKRKKFTTLTYSDGIEFFQKGEKHYLIKDEYIRKNLNFYLSKIDGGIDIFITLENKLLYIGDEKDIYHQGLAEEIIEDKALDNESIDYYLEIITDVYSEKEIKQMLAA